MTSKEQSLIPQFLNLRKEKSEIESKMGDIKTALFAPVRDKHKGKFEVPEGSAQIIEPSPRLKVTDVKQLKKQADIWAESEDPTLQANGKTILTFIEETQGKPYLTIKENK